MKQYRATREVLSAVRDVLSRTAPRSSSPLESIAEILTAGRHFSWVGIYLTVNGASGQMAGDKGLTSFAAPESRSKVMVSMRIAGREIGVLAAETERATGFLIADRVLLQNTAAVLTKFLVNSGKYLTRRARNAPQKQEKMPPRRPQSEKARASRAAVG